MKKSLVLLSLSLLLMACSQQTAAPSATPTPARPTATPQAPLPPGSRMIIRSSSMSLTVDDPVKALSALEEAIQEAGGFVVSASYYSSGDSGGYSNLSAKVPPEALVSLRQAAIELTTHVQSESLYSQDVTSQYRLLQKRLGELNGTEDHLWQLISKTDDQHSADSLALLRDLVRQEIGSVEGQMLSYEDGSSVASFDVTLNQTLQAQVIIE